MQKFKIQFILVISTLCFICIACVKTTPEVIDLVVCDRFEDWKVISEEDQSVTCSYEQIYIYKGEYYSVCECCVCDKVPMAVGCDGEFLCKLGEDCMKDFFIEAEYQYSAVEN